MHKGEDQAKVPHHFPLNYKRLTKKVKTKCEKGVKRVKKLQRPRAGQVIWHFPRTCPLLGLYLGSTSFLHVSLQMCVFVYVFLTFCLLLFCTIFILFCYTPFTPFCSLVFSASVNETDRDACPAARPAAGGRAWECRKIHVEWPCMVFTFIPASCYIFVTFHFTWF